MEPDNHYRFKEAFKGSAHVFLIAIHVDPSARKTWADIETAFMAEADGILLIRDYNTLANNHDVLATYKVARKRYWHSWIGVNLLGVSSPQAVLMVDHGTSGLWFDNAQIDEDNPESARFLADTRAKSDIFHLPDPPLIMPSVAFKGQAAVRDYAKVVHLAQPHADALVTSGVDTGVAPSTEKIRTMRQACEIPLGIASGISSENVGVYLDLGVDFFIVNTSISNTTTGRLDPDKVQELRDKIPRR